MRPCTPTTQRSGDPHREEARCKRHRSPHGERRPRGHRRHRRPRRPYPGTVATTTTATAAKTVKKNRSANVCGKVEVTSGNGTPVGKLTIAVKGRNFSQSKSFGYAGGKVCFRTAKLKKTGKYTAKVTFDAKADSVYKDSSDTTKFKVVKP